MLFSLNDDWGITEMSQVKRRNTVYRIANKFRCQAELGNCEQEGVPAFPGDDFLVPCFWLLSRWPKACFAAKSPLSWFAPEIRALLKMIT